MATHTLLTGATNAAAGASYDTATAPASWSAGDTLLVPDGSAAPTGLATAWTASTNALALALFGPECYRPIGGGGTNAALDVTNTGTSALKYYGRGAAFFAVDASMIDIRSPGSAAVYLPSGTVASLMMQQGSVVSIGEAMDVTTEIEKQGGTLDIAAYSTNVIPIITDHGGVTVSRRTCNSVFMVGPSDRTGSQHLFVLDGSAKIDTKLWQYGGKYQHKSTGVIDEAYFGRYAYATAEGAKADVTVTVARVVAGAAIRESSSGVKFILPTGSNLTEIGDVNGLGSGV